MTTEQDLDYAKSLLTWALECPDLDPDLTASINEYLGIEPSDDPMQGLPDCEPDQVDR